MKYSWYGGGLCFPNEFCLELFVEQLGGFVPGKRIEIYVFPELGCSVRDADDEGGGRQKIFDIARGQTDSLADRGEKERRGEVGGFQHIQPPCSAFLRQQHVLCVRAKELVGIGYDQCLPGKLMQRDQGLRHQRMLRRQDGIDAMVGRELKESFPSRKAERGEGVLEARDLTGNSVENISLDSSAFSIIRRIKGAILLLPPG